MALRKNISEAYMAEAKNTEITTTIRKTEMTEKVLMVWRGLTPSEKLKTFTFSGEPEFAMAIKPAIRNQTLNAKTVLKKKNQCANHKITKLIKRVRARFQFPCSFCLIRKKHPYTKKIRFKASNTSKPKMPVPTS